MKMKIVLKLATTTDSSAKQKALKTAAGIKGVYMVEWINEVQEIVVLADVDIDAFSVISIMKKKVKALQIVSVDSSNPRRRREPQQEDTWNQPPQMHNPRRRDVYQPENHWNQPPQRQALPWYHYPPNF
ncbi:hypothetical protein ACHQM5_003064 [Ranunculus cassubicifolius]